MKESVTYQEIVKEGIAIGEAQGEVREARAMLLLMGSKRLGRPSAKIRRKIETLASVKQLELLAQRLFDVTSWEELLSES